MSVGCGVRLRRGLLAPSPAYAPRCALVQPGRPGDYMERDVVTRKRKGARRRPMPRHRAELLARLRLARLLRALTPCPAARMKETRGNV